jgi:hypothetical protein
MTTDFDQLTEELYQVYTDAKVDLPEPKAIALRLIEEAVELCLAAGASPADISTSIYDALRNEHAKHPERGFNEGKREDQRELAGELADVRLLTNFCQLLAFIPDVEVFDNAKFKLHRLRQAQRDGTLHWTEDGRFYRRPKEAVSADPKTSC